MIEPLPAARRARRRPDPEAVGLATAEVFAEADRLGLGRGASRARGDPRGGCATRSAPAPRRSPTASCSSTTSSRRRSRCGRRSATRSRRCARPAPRTRWSPAPARPPSASSDRRRGARPPRRAACATRFPEAIATGAAAAREAAGSNWKWVAARPARRRDRRLLRLQRRPPHIDLQKLLEDVSNALGAWTYLLVGALAFPETGAFVGLVAPGETVMPRRRRRRPGRDLIYLLIAIAWFCACAGDTVSFFLGRGSAAASSSGTARASGSATSGSSEVEDYFARHGGKTILIGRFIGLVRALAPFIAGSSDALPALRPLQHPRHRALGHAA